MAVLVCGSKPGKEHLDRTEFEKTLATLRMNGREFARHCGVDESTVSRWGRTDGSPKIPPMAVKLLQSWLALKELGQPYPPHERSGPDTGKDPVGAPSTS